MASPRTFLPGVVTGETALDTIGQRVDRLYDNAFPWATVTSGAEADDVTVSINSNETGAPQDTAFLERGWLAGMGLRMAWPATNTGAVTLAVNGGSALSIVTPEGDAIAAAQFPSGLVIELVYYDGSFVVVSNIPAATGGEQARFWYVFTASGTWNKPAGLGGETAWHVYAWGGGAGGASVAGGGGGACAFGVFQHANLASSITVTVGAGGSTSGGAGGNTTFGSLLTGFAGRNTFGGGMISAATASAPGRIGGGDAGEDAGNAWGGAGAGTGVGAGGLAFFGGGGGTQTGTAGTSVFGGNGGTSGVAGGVRGGGGGANAIGGRGECWIFN